ncbi:MAG: HAD family hydrolase [Planctomycetes bacterium]|nr:HAD family hydrolase [Planctomycetota bacterium]
MPREAVFFDRDGTLIEEAHYLADPDCVRLIPGAADAVRALNAAGALVIVVTNQSGVARGYFPESRVDEVHERLSRLLAEFGAKVDAYYYCPHHETTGSCDCRKPKPGMLLTAARDFDIDLARSWMIGDKACDAGAGVAAGCRTLLVRTGHGATLPGAVADVGEAVSVVLRARS